MGLTALDLGVRGATAGLFLMMAVVVLARGRPLDAIKLLGVAMAVAGAAYAVVTAPFVPKAVMVWTLPVLTANPTLFWLWARATFDDDFAVRRWHGALWLVIVGIGFAVTLGWTTWPTLAQSGARLLSTVALALALLAAMQTVRTWSVDLVAGRRRLRAAVLVATLIFIIVVAGADLMSTSAAKLGVSGSLFTGLGLLIVATLAAWTLFYPPPADSGPLMTATKGSEEPGIVAQIGPDRAAEAIDPLLLRRLDYLVTVERIYRREGLTIGMLAVKLDVPDYRLRQAINEGLGYRNFNAFLNRYRLDEAKAALSDAGQRDVPVLTIAMDAGFQSIGPFNRAFKADTGLTPTEFRGDALGRLLPKRTDKDGDLASNQSRGKIG
jgi:AraC-like DNA-binding protein